MIVKVNWKVGWMDSVSFDHELGHALHGETIYCSEADLRAHSKCIDTDGTCTVKRVYVFDADAFDALNRRSDPDPQAGGKGRAE